MASIDDLFEEHAAASLEKQWALGDYIGDADWQLSLDRGTITFASKHTFPVQVLGTESEYSHTWLWAWANEASNIPPRLLQCATMLRELGAQRNIAELTEPQIDLDSIEGHQLALIAAGVCQADCYYRGPYEGGAVFVLLEAPEIRRQAEPSALQFVNVFSHLISLYPFNHRPALEAYLRYKGYRYRITEAGIEATTPDGETIRAAFDQYDRLADLSTKLQK